MEQFLPRDESLNNAYIITKLTADATQKTLQQRCLKLYFLYSLQANRTLDQGKIKLQKELNQLKQLNANMVKTLQTDIMEITGQKVKAEAKIRFLQQQMQLKQEAYEQMIEKINEQNTQQIDKKHFEIQGLNARIAQLHKFANTKSEFQARLNQLETDLQQEKRLHQQDVEEMDREKIKATQKLKKDMLYKIKQTHQHVLALNDQQLHTTTRFTVLENHRLTTQLEYQSKQTEKLMNRNTQLEQQVVSFKRDIKIHKQVQAQLAKRSHYCQKIIKKLNMKIKEMEQNMIIPKRDSRLDAQDLDSKQDSRMNDELIRFLQNKLEQSMNRLAQLQMEHNLLKSENNQLMKKSRENNEKYQNLGCLLSDYLADLKSMTGSVSYDDDLTLNIHRIANSDIESLSPADRANLVVALLKQIQPYVSPSNVSIPTISNVNIITAPTPTGEDFPTVKKAPSISVGVQTSFALGTFDLPKLEVDAELVKGPVRPWGAKTSQSRDSSYNRKRNIRR